jgi:putative methylase
LIAADVLFNALLLDDLLDKKVVELGCGNGIFAIGAKLLGAEKVVGVDSDESALDVAKQNMKKLDVKVDFLVADVSAFSEHCDTVLQNPPFGAQKSHKHADILFIKKAFEIGNVVYSMHLAKTKDFILKNIELCGGEATMIKTYKFPIPHTYPFHKKEIKSFDVILIRGVKSNETQRDSTSRR